jgi:hypothetical protein
LHSGRIQDHDREKRFGCRGHQDASRETFLDKFGDEPAVVEVDVGEEEVIYSVWREGESLPVSV